MKKGKSITFQLLDPAEKNLYDYCSTIHNFSGTMKRLLMASEGFKHYQEQQETTNAPQEQEGNKENQIIYSEALRVSFFNLLLNHL